MIFRPYNGAKVIYMQQKPYLEVRISTLPQARCVWSRLSRDAGQQQRAAAAGPVRDQDSKQLMLHGALSRQCLWTLCFMSHLSIKHLSVSPASGEKK